MTALIRSLLLLKLISEERNKNIRIPAIVSDIKLDK